MRVIICGGRDHPPFRLDYEVAFLDTLHSMHHFTEGIFGGARGADTFADQWAESRGINRVIFPANWKGEGKVAGAKRNQQMLEYLVEKAPPTGQRMRVLKRLIIGFSGGRGTEHMLGLGVRYGVETLRYTGERYEPC